MAVLRAVPERPPRAVLYLRQSVTREDSISIELQETACRDYCERAGYVVVGVEADPGISGRTWARPGVQNVLAIVERGDADVVILWKWSRLSRSRRDWAIAADRVDVAGGRIESATEAVDVATSVGRLARGMLTEFAAFESERIGEVWKEVHERRLSKGLPSRGGARFGYQRQDQDYVIDERTGPLLARMYADYLAGHGLAAIARTLNDAGWATTSGGPWTRDRVTKLLDSGFAAGLLIRGKGRTATYRPGRHEPVIDDTTWQAYRDARRLRTQDGIPPAPRYVLAGLLVCGDCGAPMHANRLGVTAGYGYACSRWATLRDVRCVTVTRSKAEHAVMAEVAAIAEAVDDAAAAADTRQHVRAIARADVAELARRLGRVDERLTRLTLGWTDGTVPDAAYRSSRDELQAERERLDLQLAAARIEQGRAHIDRREVATGLLLEWDTLPVLTRSQLLRTLFDRVEVHRGAKRNDVRVVVVAR